MKDSNVIPIGTKNKNLANDQDILSQLNYFAPEFIEFFEESPAMDFWALGCIIYFMLTGKEPFEGRTRQDVVRNILNNELRKFDDDINLSDEGKDIIDKLLQLNPVLRLGAGKPGQQNHICELKKHPWFTSLNSFHEVDELFNK